MTGADLRQLLIDKWGYSFDICLRKTQGKIFVQVMWRYLEQASFPMTETEYLQHLNGVCSYLESWGGTEQVRRFIQETRDRPRIGKAVNIPIDLGERTSEWLLGD